MSEMIATGAAAIAAICSLVAVRQMQKFWRAERRSEVYRRVGLERVLAARGRFFEGVEDVLERAKASDEPESLLTEFNRIALAYRAAIAEMRQIRVLPLGPCADELQRETFEVQDPITKMLDGDMGGNDVSWPELRARHAGRVADILARHDPALSKKDREKATGRKDEKPNGDTSTV